MTELQQSILKVVQAIPEGKVMSYGQLAAYLGRPRAAREIGWALSSMDGTPDFPWWRVLNNAGKITIRGNQFSNAEQQQALLQAEGIKVHDFQLDMEKYRFRPDAVLLKSFKLNAAVVESLLEKYGDPSEKLANDDQATLF